MTISSPSNTPSAVLPVKETSSPFILALLLIFSSAFLASSASPPSSTRSTSHLPPRKVIVGTTMQSFWGPHPGLTNRIQQLLQRVDEMATEAQKTYGRGLDLAVLPENAISGEADGDAWNHSFAYEGPIQQAFSQKARELHCYLVVPTYLKESDSKKICSNAALLIDREGKLMATYRKRHLVVNLEKGTMEAGTTPGSSTPVFECDFGKLGIQICYDMNFEEGWKELERQGADLVVWPTQSPQTSQPAFRAKEHRFYIVSSTWRHNASIFEPTGKIVRQISLPQHTLVQELDLSYALLPWSSRLKNGRTLQEKYGDKVGFRYYEDEDCGIFWSNNPNTSIAEMVRPLQLLELEDELKAVRDFYHQNLPAKR